MAIVGDSQTPNDPVAKYLEWNDRIFERFFPIDSQRPVRILAFDESELRAIATEMNTAQEEFAASIRSLIRYPSRDLFSWWALPLRGSMTEREPPYYVALLAIFSLAASQTGGAIENGARAFFHRHLAHLLGIPDIAWVPGFADATKFYEKLSVYLREGCDGMRGTLLVASTYFGGEYVGRARAQVLLNTTSRRQLASYFDRHFPTREELSKAEIEKRLCDDVDRGGSYTLPPVLARTLRILKTQEHSLYAGFLDLVETEYIKWYLDRPETLLSATSTQRTYRIAPDATRKSHRHPVREIVLSAAHTPAHSPRRPRVEKRLLLRSGLGTLPWVVSVQCRRPNEEWRDASITTLSWEDGIITFEMHDGFCGTIVTDDIIAFVDFGDGWVDTQYVRAGQRCAILCGTETAGTLKRSFEEISGTSPTLHVCAGASEASIVSVDIPHATVEAIPDSLRSLLLPDEARVSFRRGLRIGDQYLMNAPPRVFFDHASVLETTIVLDGVVLDVPAKRRTEYELPRNLSEGLHQVELLGIQKSFTSKEITVQSATDISECAGFEVCYGRGVSIPEQHPGETQTSTYHNAKTIIIIGGLVL